MTLAEVVIAMVVFSFMAISLSALAIFSRRSSQANAIRVAANAAATNYMEQLLAMPFAFLRDAALAPTTQPVSVLNGDGTSILLYPGTPASDTTVSFSTTILNRETSRRVTLTFTLFCTLLNTDQSVAVRLDYAWLDPATGRTITSSMRAIRNSF